MSGSLGFCQNTPLVGLLVDPTLAPEGAREKELNPSHTPSRGS